MAQVTTRITTGTTGTILLGYDFNTNTLPNRTDLSSAKINFDRYFLVPKSLIDTSKLNNVTKIEANVSYSNNRTAGIYSIHVRPVSGNPSAVNVVAEASIDYSTASNTNSLFGIDTPGIYGDFLDKYLDNSILFTYNGQQYYAFQFLFEMGVISKYSGTLVVNRYEMKITHDDSSKIFNGSSNITSAYLGSTPINGIYLGSQKLL